MPLTLSTSTPLHKIASVIEANWASVNFAAQPYVDAMFALSTLDDRFGADDARSIVLYFLSNASTWRGPVAQDVKRVLKEMLAEHDTKKAR